MKYCALIVLLIMACTSCGSFHRAHYRHVKMVHTGYESLESKKSVQTNDASTQPLTETIECAVVANPEIEPLDSDVVSAELKQPDTQHSHWQEVQQSVVSQVKLPVKKKLFSKDLRHDWSLLIATLLIISGILMFVYIGVFLAAAPISLFVRILLSILLSSVAVKMLVEGISIYTNRFRSGKNYKETQ